MSLDYIDMSILVSPPTSDGSVAEWRTRSIVPGLERPAAAPQEMPSYPQAEEVVLAVAVDGMTMAAMANRGEDPEEDSTTDDVRRPLLSFALPP